MSTRQKVMGVETPECDKLVRVAPLSQEIGHFLDWLQEQGIQLCDWSDEDEQYVHHYEPFALLLARYFDVDMNKVDRERQQILDALRTPGNWNEPNDHERNN